MGRRRHKRAAPKADAGDDPRVILLFDLNGTLTSHTSERYSSGTSKVRPNVARLLELKPAFRIGVFTSSTSRTASGAIALLEAEAGVGPGQLFEPGLVFHRQHTCPVPEGHKQGPTNAWDTCKPLNKWFKKLHRVVLIDDDLHKAYPGEEGNLVLMPQWDEGASCNMIGSLVRVLQEEMGALSDSADSDVRLVTAIVSQRILT